MTRKLFLAFVVALITLMPGVALAAGLTVAWDADKTGTIAKYVVSYGTLPGQYSGTKTVSGTATQAALTNLTEGSRYYISVVAVDTTGLSSVPSDEVNGVVPYAAQGDTTTHAARILLGLGTFPGNGGWAPTLADASLNFGTHDWARLPWDAYNMANGEIHPAVGDVDGDGLDEVVLGMGSGGGGWICILDDDQHGYALLKWIRIDWDAYNAANGSVYPAVGDLDGDGKAEIVAGLGPGGGGWYQIFDNASAGYKSLGWGRVQWDAYNKAYGETHPAVGDFDGDGKADIALGFASGGAGWVDLVKWTGTKVAEWQWQRLDWDSYNAIDGSIWPAAGDLTGDGKAELVLGFGKKGAGWLEVRADATKKFAPIKWLNIDWADYTNRNGGETHPTIGNIDDDAKPEIVVGLGRYAGHGGWFLMIDDAGSGYKAIGWRQSPWGTFNAAGGAIFPAVGTLR